MLRASFRSLQDLKSWTFECSLRLNFHCFHNLKDLQDTRLLSAVVRYNSHSDKDKNSPISYIKYEIFASMKVLRLRRKNFFTTCTYHKTRCISMLAYSHFSCNPSFSLDRHEDRSFYSLRPWIGRGGERAFHGPFPGTPWSICGRR